MEDVEEYDPRAHKSLLSAISDLGKSQHIRKTTRTEPQIEQDEYLTVKKPRVKLLVEDTAPDSKPFTPVAVNDLTRTLRKTKKHLDASKAIKNVQQSKKVLTRPLEKPAAERIKRTVGFEKAKTQLGRWDAIVSKNRAAETKVFPLTSETIYVDTSAHAKPVATSLKSELMREMEAAEARLIALKRQRAGNFEDPEDERKREEALLQLKLTREELMARRRELAYLKMRESQQSAKARLRNKIKSKKYHKLLKRQKMQAQLKEFEALQKVNPEAALEKLNELEKNRLMERATLRHKNTGTWAKNLQVRAKYDKDVRKDLAEQLQLSRELTQKKQALEENSNVDDDEDGGLKSDEDANGPDAENGEVAIDPFNSWLVVKAGGKHEKMDAENSDPNWRKYWLERNSNEKLLEAYKAELEKAQSDTESDENNEPQDAVSSSDVSENKADVKAPRKRLEANPQKQCDVRKKKKSRKPIENGWIVEDLGAEDTIDGEAKNDSEKMQKKVKSYENVDLDDLFDEKEYRIKAKLSRDLKEITKRAKKMEKRKKKKVAKTKDELKQLKDLSFKQDAKRPIIDEELLDESTADQKSKKASQGSLATEATGHAQSTVADATTKDDVDGVDPTNIASVKLKQTHLQTLGMVSDVVGNENDDAMVMEDSDDDMEESKHMTISEAFEDDDIIADFSRDKAKDSEVKNAEIELTMPGWGSWAGAGLAPKPDSRSKAKRLILKPAPEEKRRDENKSTLYINEESSKQMRSHLVSDIPFPFTSLKDYEASIRAPIGRSFVPETTFRLLTRPSVITKKGRTIEPMDESELVKPSRRPRNVVDKRIQFAEKTKKIQSETNQPKKQRKFPAK